MDCQEVRELLDAHALGAVERGEGHAVEQHIRECVRCWDELSEAQRTAALLAISVPTHEAPPRLRDRLLQRAHREARPKARARLSRLLPRLWPVGAGGLAASALAALALAAFAQTEMDDLRDDNSQLEQQVGEAQTLVDDQRQLMAVMAAPDRQQVRLQPDDPNSEVVAVYYWSEAIDSGFLVCNNLPRLPQGQAYQVWLVTDEGGIAVGSFRSWKGIGHLPVDLEVAREPPTAIAVSIEAGAGDEEAAAEAGEESAFLYGALETGQ